MVFRTYTEDVLIDSGVDANLRSYLAEEAVLAGQAVKLGTTNDEAVEPSDADGEQVVGVAIEDAAQGKPVTVARDGTKVRATSGTGTISRRDFVSSYGASGEEGEVQTATETDVTGATPVNGDYVLGVAVRDDVGANDTVVVEIDTGRI